MKNKIYSHLPAIIFGVLVVSFLAAFYIFAWTEPTEVPPGGNVPAPINVSSVDQIKQGSLSLNIAGISPTGLIVNRDAIFLNGNVGIGTTSPNQKLDVSGQIHATGEICTDAGGGACLSSSGGRITPVGPQSCIGAPACAATVTCPIGTHVLYAIYHLYNQNGCPGPLDQGPAGTTFENGDCSVSIPGQNAPNFLIMKDSSCSNVTAIAGPAGTPQACILAFCIAN